MTVLPAVNYLTFQQSTQDLTVGLACLIEPPNLASFRILVSGNIPLQISWLPEHLFTDYKGELGQSFLQVIILTHFDL